MPTIQRFEEIEAWQTARELTKLIYSFTEEGKCYAPSRRFGQNPSLIYVSLRDVLRKVSYSFTEEGKFSRDFGLKDQIQRASVSIMSNISEGFESQTQAQFIRYLGLAKASAGEVRSQLYVSRDLDYITQEVFTKAFAMVEKASRQIARFISYLETHPQSHKIREDSAEYEV